MMRLRSSAAWEAEPHLDSYVAQHQFDAELRSSVAPESDRHLVTSMTGWRSLGGDPQSPV
jgi:hypothetical protein